MNLMHNINPNSTGKIKIVTERDMCSFCAGAVDQFKVARPGIEIEVVYRTPYP